MGGGQSVIMEVDHRGIGVTYKSTLKIIKGRSYSHYDKGKFIQDLQDTIWDCIVQERNTNSKIYSLMYATFMLQ